MSILTLNISVSGLQIGSTIKRKACDLTLPVGMTMDWLKVRFKIQKVY